MILYSCALGLDAFANVALQASKYHIDTIFCIFWKKTTGICGLTDSRESIKTVFHSSVWN